MHDPPFGALFKPGLGLFEAHVSPSPMCHFQHFRRLALQDAEKKKVVGQCATAFKRTATLPPPVLDAAPVQQPPCAYAQQIAIGFHSATVATGIGRRMQCSAFDEMRGLVYAQPKLAFCTYRAKLKSSPEESLRSFSACW